MENSKINLTLISNVEKKHLFEMDTLNFDELLQEMALKNDFDDSNESIETHQAENWVLQATESESKEQNHAKSSDEGDFFNPLGAGIVGIGAVTLILGSRPKDPEKTYAPVNPTSKKVLDHGQDVSAVQANSKIIEKNEHHPINHENAIDPNSINFNEISAEIIQKQGYKNIFMDDFMIHHESNHYLYINTGFI